MMKIPHSKKPLLGIFFACCVIFLSACTRTVNSEGWTPLPQAKYPATPTPFSLLPTQPGMPTPVQLPPTRDPSMPMSTPTPDAPHAIPTPPPIPENYTVEAGDTLGIIAQKFGISPESVVQVNAGMDPNLLYVGQVLELPNRSTSAGASSSFKIIPDSELVYGPFSTVFDINQYVQSRGGYLAGYTEEVNGEMLTGAQVVERVAQDYSVNPRLLLALLDYRAGWVTAPEPAPGTQTYPLGWADGWHIGLYRQLTWAANALNHGFYGWQADAIPQWTLADGTVSVPDATINAGTAGVQYLFSLLDDANSWQMDVGVNGLFTRYFLMFGFPFDFSIEPLMPSYVSQPTMALPFGIGETWNFTGGPHGGWDSGSAWAALDFAPPGEGAGCMPSDYWVTAVMDGNIVRSDNGMVVQEQDGDGFMQTGWSVLYLHIGSFERVPVGSYVKTGDRIGHPSCEGGFSNATHLHLARRYNGMWIPADGSMPFNLDGWVSSGTGVEYDGFLTKNGVQKEAWDGYNEVNQISR